jgi:transposase
MFIMKSQRRAFMPEFKDEVVKLVINTGRPIAAMTGELGLIEQALSHWAKAYRDRLEAGERGLSESERIELLRLRK